MILDNPWGDPGHVWDWSPGWGQWWWALWPGDLSTAIWWRDDTNTEITPSHKLRQRQLSADTIRQTKTFNTLCILICFCVWRFDDVITRVNYDLHIVSELCGECELCSGSGSGDLTRARVAVEEHFSLQLGAESESRIGNSLEVTQRLVRGEMNN